MNLYPRAVTPEDGIPFDAAAVEAEAAHVRAWLNRRRERQAPETATAVEQAERAIRAELGDAA